MSGKELAKMRKDAKISQLELAKAIGVSRSTLIKIEQSDKVDSKYEKKLVKAIQKSAKNEAPSAPKTEEKETSPKIKPITVSVVVDDIITEETVKEIKEELKEKKSTEKKTNAVAQKKADNKPDKKTDSKPVKKAPAKTDTPASDKKTVPFIELQYAGKSITYQDIVNAALKLVSNPSDLKIYVKPEENRAYYVCGKDVGSFEI